MEPPVGRQDRVQPRRDGEHDQHAEEASPGNGHALICVGPDDVGDPPIPVIEAYEREIATEVRQRLGPRAGLINPIVGTVFPNFSLLRGTSRTFRVWQPRGPEKTEVRSFVFMDKAAPPEVKRAIRQAGIRGFSPSGSFEQDDMDNWQEYTQTCRGVMSRRMPLNTQMGLGHDRFDPALGAWVSDSGSVKATTVSSSPLVRVDGGSRLGCACPHDHEGSEVCLTRIRSAAWNSFSTGRLGGG